MRERIMLVMAAAAFAAAASLVAIPLPATPADSSADVLVVIEQGEPVRDCPELAADS